MATDDGTAGLPAVGGGSSFIGGIVAVAEEAGEHVERAPARLAGAVEVSSQVLQRVGADVLAQTTVDTVAQQVEVLGRLDGTAHHLFDVMAKGKHNC